MFHRLVRRSLQAVVSLACIYVATFCLVVLAPGNPFAGADRNMPPEVYRALSARYSLDSPVRYFFEFLAGAVRFDFGPSFQYRDWTCTQIIASSLPASLTVGAAALAIGAFAGVPLGILGAVRRDSAFDAAIAGVTLVGVCVPAFVSGSLLLTLFAVYWHALPIGGWGSPGHLVLPAITLSLPFVATISRLTRIGMIDALGSDFVRTAVAKGLPRSHIIRRHVRKVALLPVLSYLGPASAQALTGSFVVEKLFAVPGLGVHFVDAALNLDRGLIMSCVMVYAAILIAANLVVDLAYAWLDPRIRVGA